MDMDMDMDMEMIMSFFTSKHVTILFREWVTSNTVGYIMTLVAIVTFGIFTLYLKSVKENLIDNQRKRMNNCIAKKTADESNTVGIGTAFAKPCKKCCACFSYPAAGVYIICLTFVISMFDFCLMLIAMTFESGVLLATCLGVSLGYILFIYPTRLENAASDNSPRETTCCDVC